MASSQTDHLRNFLTSHPQIKKIRCQAVTYGNVNLTRFLTVSRALEIAASPPLQGGSIHCVSPSLRNFAATGHLDHDFNSGDEFWVPDFSTLRLCAVDPDHATCMVNVIEPEVVDTEEQWALDPRAILQRVQQSAEDKGFKILFGAEIEFYFLDSPSADTVVQVPDLPLYNSAATRHPTFKVVDEAVDVLEANGVGVWGFHNEGASSKFEISLRPADPITAIDQLAYAQQVIKDIANKHGLLATMHPQAFPDKWPTAGQHLHVSVSKAETTSDGDQFLAGLLEHLPAVSAFLLAGYDSYMDSRKFWYGGGPVMWSTGKGGPIRRHAPNHFELRMGDCLGNPYFQAAAILAAGLSGIEAQLPLTMKPSEGVLTEHYLNDEQLRQLGITKRLPTALSAAVEVLKSEEGKWIEHAFGTRALKAYIKVKENEVKDSGGMDVNDRRRAILRHI